MKVSSERLKSLRYEKAMIRIWGDPQKLDFCGSVHPFTRKALLSKDPILYGVRFPNSMARLVPSGTVFSSTSPPDSWWNVKTSSGSFNRNPTDWTSPPSAKSGSLNVNVFLTINFWVRSQTSSYDKIWLSFYGIVLWGCFTLKVIKIICSSVTETNPILDWIACPTTEIQIIYALNINRRRPPYIFGGFISRCSLGSN